MTLPESILIAIHQAPDYSVAFTLQVAEIAKEIEGVLTTPVEHDSDMNYRHGQSISFISSHPHSHQKIPKPSPIEVRIYISSRSKLYALYCFDLKLKYMQPSGLNHPMPLELMPESSADQIEHCRRVMLSRGYTEVSALQFKEPAPGCLTEIDGLPANTFQALFAEEV
jgi:hypothetical protein